MPRADRMKFRKLHLAVLVLAFFLPARTAHAYVDPGVLSVLFQALYVTMFGAAAAFIFRPWNYLKSLFKKDKPNLRAATEPEMDNSE